MPIKFTIHITPNPIYQTIRATGEPKGVTQVFSFWTMMDFGDNTVKSIVDLDFSAN